MAHAASHIKKARLELAEQNAPDQKALEKAKERRRRSRERAERKRKVHRDPCATRCDIIIIIGIPLTCFLLRSPSHTALFSVISHLENREDLRCIISS